MMTIKQIADELNVSKSSIRKMMTENFRELHIVMLGNTIGINDLGVEKIRKHFFQKNNEGYSGMRSIKKFNLVQNKTEIAVINFLMTELERRNKEIEEKNKIINRILLIIDNQTSEKCELNVDK